MSKKIIKSLIIIIFLLTISLSMARFVFADDNSTLWGGQEGEIGNAIGLSGQDPRVMVAKIIRVSLGFLGILAVCLIIYAGWMYMTAGEEQDKVDQAKAILKNAVIGLIIILMCFGIASLVLKLLSDATGDGGGDGSICDPPCASGNYCCNSVCQSSPCSGGGGGGGSDEENKFYINAVSPLNNSTNVIRNAKIRFTFNAVPNETTVSTSTFVVKSNNVFVNGIRKVDNNTIEFTPNALCPENECNAINCFSASSTINVEVLNGVSGVLRASNGLELNCGLGESCAMRFTTGNLIDCKDPEINFWYDSMDVCAGVNNTIGANAQDDTGVALVKFYANETLINNVGNPNNNNPFSASVVWNGSGYTTGTDVNFKAVAYDIDSHNATTTAVVKLRPAHCCNQVQDENEEGIDCGGADCVSCENQGPVIYSISPAENGTPNGSPGNIITIQGKNFGVVEKLFENVLTNVDFETGAVGGVPTDWGGRFTKHACVGISQNQARSGSKSVLIYQEPNKPYPGTCTKAICDDTKGTGVCDGTAWSSKCTWATSTQQCSFAGIDSGHLTAPAIYNKGEGLRWGNTNRVMWGVLTYNVAPLKWQVGEKYVVKFYYKGRSDITNIPVTLRYSLGWAEQCVPKSGIYINPDGTCKSNFGSICAKQPTYCCAQAPVQEKCYQGTNLPPIKAGTYNNWTAYSAILTYTEAMANLKDKNGDLKNEIGLAMDYGSVGASGTDLYIDDFTVVEIPEKGSVTFLGNDNVNTDDQIATFPSDLNPNCKSTWQNDKIIVVVPNNAITGPIKVVAESGLFDKTNNNFGPFINNFEINDIARPGLCGLSQGGAVFGTELTYYGINLLNSTAYFGNTTNKIDALNSSFLDDLQGTAKVPNITLGKTTTFVLKNSTSSNYLDFTKDPEPATGPSIISFNPTSGKSGQYITIRGSGFGRLQGTSKVYFGNTAGIEASYDFPKICSDSVWSDNQALIKVPENIANNDYILTMQIQEKIINTNKLSPSKFTVNSSLSLKPSLCKINPIIGSNNSEISLWGEYFGDKATGKVKFNSNKDQAGNAISFWGQDEDANKITTTVHQSAITGPVKIVQGTNVGNGINFTVGECVQNTDCGGTNVCCPANTSEKGRCKANIDGCYISVQSSVYEWSFNTGGGGNVGDPCDGNENTSGCQADNTKCNSGLTCDSTKNCTCQLRCTVNQTPCGGSCCNGACENVVNSTCANVPCASPRITCGTECCANGVINCINGECSQTPCSVPGQTRCGLSCCDPGKACENAASSICEGTVCASPTPITCGTKCCANTNGCDPTNTAKCFSCALNQNKCEDGNCCNTNCIMSYSGRSVCPGSCGSYETGQCLGNFCPNSPGKCSAYAGGVDQEVGVSCDDSVCNGGVCGTEGCIYNNNLNKCVKTIDSYCSLQKIVKDISGKDTNAYCDIFLGALSAQEQRWHINTTSNCPDNWDWDGVPRNNKNEIRCIEKNTTCVLCSTGFECLDNNGTGICGIDKTICQPDSTCNANGKCITKDSSSCECCCSIAQNDATNGYNPSCCSPLTCAGRCGSSIGTTAPAVFGYCSGCANAGTTQRDRDAACNCSGSYGKYCDTSVSNGVCRDCAQLSTTACSAYSTCCVDFMNNSQCAGIGSGTAIVSGATNYCGYYTCATTPSYVCEGPSKDGVYRSSDNCNAKCKGDTGDSCGSSCSATKNSCLSGICDLTTCTCKSGDNPPGTSCYDASKLSCSFGCATGYGCLGTTGCSGTNCSANDTSCLCCCDPAGVQCKNINENLVCKANQTPCTGDVRGLCCGCASDSECVPVTNPITPPRTVGCGSDACCRPRPSVNRTTNPVDNAKNICRNTVITANFNQKMDINSFSGNVLVVGDYVSNPCPTNTQYKLTFGGTETEKAGVELLQACRSSTPAFSVSALWQKIKNSFLALFSDKTLANTPNSTHNYCAITGSVSGTHNADNTTTLTFSPAQLLDPDRLYYVIIKGDKNLDSKNGVKNLWGIGMKGPNTETFNSVKFENSKVWSFTTLDGNNSICKLDHVEIDPSSYLFQTTEAGLNENDYNPDDKTFDTVKDNDKKFIATAKTVDGQTIMPVAGYNWEWSWSIDNTDVVYRATEPKFTASSSQQLIRTETGVVDNKTFVNIKATLTDGTIKTDKAEVFVFLCQNPWPAVQTNGLWYTWKDTGTNCTLNPTCAGGPTCANCLDAGYELYYCRDAGNAGTADDLPAILNNAIIRGSSTPQNLLKETYFFREATPDVSGINLTVSSISSEGKKVSLNWLPIPLVAGKILENYKIYYGNVSQYYNTATTTTTTTITISGLTNNKIYYFAITAIYQNKAESSYSNEVSAIPEDTVGPTAPKINSISLNNEQVEINWSDMSNGDAKNFKIFYKASLICNANINFATSQITVSSPTAIAGSSDNSMYCFGMVGYDLDGNPSATTTATY